MLIAAIGRSALKRVPIFVNYDEAHFVDLSLVFLYSRFIKNRFCQMHDGLEDAVMHVSLHNFAYPAAMAAGHYYAVISAGFRGREIIKEKHDTHNSINS